MDGVKLGRIVSFDVAAQCLDPNLAGSIDVEVRYLGSSQKVIELLEIAAEINSFSAIPAHGCCSTSVKSRSLAARTLMLVPGLTVSVGLISVAGATVLATP